MMDELKGVQRMVARILLQESAAVSLGNVGRGELLRVKSYVEVPSMRSYDP